MAIFPAKSLPLLSKKPKKSILERLPGKLPTSRIPAVLDIESVAKSMVERFPALTKECFTEDALWRDSYALTGTFRTFYFDTNVAQQWLVLREHRQPTSEEYIAGSGKIISTGPESSYLECKFRFTTKNPVTECSGFLSLVPTPSGDGWRIWILRTVLEQLPGHGNVDIYQPPSSPISNGILPEQSRDHGQNGNRVSMMNGNGDSHGHQISDNTADTNGTSAKFKTQHFHAVVIGGGQAGLCTGGRLQALGVSYVVIEKNAEVGDAWRLRYESARRKSWLHGSTLCNRPEPLTYLLLIQFTRSANTVSSLWHE